ncbi:MAG: SEL1-like repeat protein [Rhodoferax sp.]
MKTTIQIIALALSLTTVPNLAFAKLEEGTAAYQRKDYAAAFQELLPVAQEGNAQAQQMVGNMYLHGAGVARNDADAAKWFRLSADQGNAVAMKAMGRLYVQGRGLEQDLREATVWFRRAKAKASSPQPAADMDEDAAKRLATAKELSTECRQEPPKMPALALQHNVGGNVVAHAFMVDGDVEDVIIESGPRGFQNEVRWAMLQYDCPGKKYTGLATQEFNFVIDNGPIKKPVYSVAQRAPVFWTAPPPFNASWLGLSPEHKLAVRAQYANLLADDEPPYPSEGMGALVEDIRLTAQHLGVAGGLYMDVRVDANGEVETVNILKTPSPELGQYAAAVAFRASYKPAVCAGNPCAMSLPVDIVITALKPGSRFKDAKALDMLRSAAESGDLRAQNDLGERYEYGRGVNRDMAQAIKWYRESANQGFASGQNNLGRSYEAGRGVDKNLTEAADWYRKSAEQSYAPAQSNYGYMLAHGRGVPVDLPGSVQWYQKSAAQGYAGGQNNLGWAYQHGLGVEKDLVKAVSLYELAAKKNHALAQLNLAKAHATGQGTQQDAKLYATWIKRSAESGNSEGQYGLGLVHTLGLGAPLDLTEASKWFRKSAARGNPNGQNALADAYQKGQGVPQNDTEAVKWYRLAAQQKLPSAMYNLYKMYADGRGVAKDLAIATDWLQQAAEKGDDEAQTDLAKAYEAGIGVEKNAAAALRWHDKARKSHQEAIDGLKSTGFLKMLVEHCSANTVEAGSDACKDVLKQLAPH